MPGLAGRHALLLAMLLLGACSQVIQGLLVREALVVFYGNEVSLGVFFGSWLFWIAAGSAAVLGLRERPWVRDARVGVARILLSVPLLLLAQMAALRSVRWVLDVPSVELVPLGDLLLSLFLLTAPMGLALGLGFPLVCKALADAAGGEAGTGPAVRGVSGLYVVEALGALAGGVLFTFVLIQWAGPWRTLGLVTVSLALAAAALGGSGLRARSAAVALALAGLLLAATPVGRYLGDGMERLRFGALQPGLELVDAVETRYGHVALARLGGQLSVVTDGHIAESFPEPREAEQAAAYLYAQAAGAKRVLVLGGFAGGLPAELLRYPLERLDVVEQDRRAFEQVRPHLPPEGLRALEDPRLAIHFLDGRRFLNALPEDTRFDLVLSLHAVPTSAHSNRYFTLEFFRGVRALLAPDGVFCTQVSSASNYLGGTVRGYSGSVFHTLREVLPEVAVLPGDTQVYCAAARPGRVSEDPSELMRRYLAAPLDEHRFPSLSFYSLMPAGHIGYLREQLLGAESDLNSDARPVTYYLNMLLWGQFSASDFADALERLRRMGPWPYLVPLAVLLVLWPLRASLEGFQRPRLRRHAGSYALAVLGLVAMAAQIAVLFAYQAHVGFVFERVALLNALFMAGLALGAGSLGQGLARGGSTDGRLAGLMGLAAAGLAALPAALGGLGGLEGTGQEMGFLGLSGLAGLLTGAGFPLGVRLAHEDTGEVAASGGIAEAADSLGGALGGLLTGALLVPLLGVVGTGRLLALICLSAVPLLLFARHVPEDVPALRIRGGRAFPWSLPGWVLGFLVLCLLGWDLAQRGSAPPPRVQFDESRLAAVSGSEGFVEVSEPFVHYRGWNPNTAAEAAPDTAALSSLTVASEVRGFAGPLNLLLALDREGRLRGVQHVDSDETPAYIAGIDPWLAGLTGQDLSAKGLDLSRVDGLSGATVTSRAALEAINRSARAAGAQVFGKDLASEPSAPRPRPVTEPRFLATLALLVLFVPVYFWGGERARLAFQALSLLVLGVWLNSLVTEVDLANLLRGLWPSPAENPQRWLLLGFVLASGLLLGQVWCGYLCPFGALQEFVSRLGRRLGLRAYVARPLDTRLRFLKFLLLALMLGAVLATGDTFWASFNPMQHAFSGRIEGWMGLLLALVLVGALFHVRLWCRYLCPFGAFLALTNKVALLHRLAPKRRFEHCDLGVREAFRAASRSTVVV